MIFEDKLENTLVSQVTVSHLFLDCETACAFLLPKTSGSTGACATCAINMSSQPHVAIDDDASELLPSRTTTDSD